MIASGDVLPRYPYLWRWQEARGEETGRKDRPVCVAIASTDASGLTHVALLAITSKQPRDASEAIEVPVLELKRIGLDDSKRAWIIVSEYNYDVIERSFALEQPRKPLKKLSPAFLKAVVRAFRPTLLDQAARVNRV